MLNGGVIWLVRNGTNYVDGAIEQESAEFQTTGTLRMLADVISARSAVGHDSQGRVVMAQVEGKTLERG